MSQERIRPVNMGVNGEPQSTTEQSASQQAFLRGELQEGNNASANGPSSEHQTAQDPTSVLTEKIASGIAGRAGSMSILNGPSSEHQTAQDSRSVPTEDIVSEIEKSRLEQEAVRMSGLNGPSSEHQTAQSRTSLGERKNFLEEMDFNNQQVAQRAKDQPAVSPTAPTPEPAKTPASEEPILTTQPVIPEGTGAPAAVAGNEMLDHPQTEIQAMLVGKTDEELGKMYDAEIAGVPDEEMQEFRRKANEGVPQTTSKSSDAEKVKAARIFTKNMLSLAIKYNDVQAQKLMKKDLKSMTLEDILKEKDYYKKRLKEKEYEEIIGSIPSIGQTADRKGLLRILLGKQNYKYFSPRELREKEISVLREAWKKLPGKVQPTTSSQNIYDNPDGATPAERAKAQAQYMKNWNVPLDRSKENYISNITAAPKEVSAPKETIEMHMRIMDRQAEQIKELTKQVAVLKMAEEKRVEENRVETRVEAFTDDQANEAKRRTDEAIEAKESALGRKLTDEERIETSGSSIREYIKELDSPSQQAMAGAAAAPARTAV